MLQQSDRFRDGRNVELCHVIPELVLLLSLQHSVERLQVHTRRVCELDGCLGDVESGLDVVRHCSKILKAPVRHCKARCRLRQLPWLSG